jgi:chromosome transmission fidelity protein 4
LKGGDQYPYFPRPLLSEFDFSIPLTSVPEKANKKRSSADGDDEEMADATSEAEQEEEKESTALSQSYLLKTLQSSQLSDLLEFSKSTASERASLARLELEIDKTLLQMLAVECREGGEERGMRALEVVQLMRDRSGKMVEAAGKIAERYGRNVLGEKIRELGEERVGEMRGGSGRGGRFDEDDDDF